MNNINKRPLRSAQSGVTLIELMISITIGLVILIGIGTAYLNSTNTTRQRENQSELNEPARVVMHMLQHDVSFAGYVDVLDLTLLDPLDPALGFRPQAASLFIPGNDALLNLYQRAATGVPLGAPITQFFGGLMPVFGCDGAMNSTPFAISTGGAPAVLTCGAAHATRHTMQIAYQAAPRDLLLPTPTPENPIVSLLQPNANTGQGRDCNQQRLEPDGAKFVINRYFVRASTTDGINELYCSGSGNALEQPLARGVEEFVLRYQLALPGPALLPGIAPIAAGSAQAQYVSAAGVAGSTLGWANVTAVEICLVSATTATGGGAAAGTTDLQPTRPTCARAASGNFAPNVARIAGDLRLWKRFTSVVSVRNAIYSTPN